MLQIISGKFFNSDNRYAFDSQAILFSNYSWIDRVNGKIATLCPVFSKMGNQPVYIMEFVNQIEKTENSVLVRTSEDEIITQFQNILMFGLKSIFDTEKRVIEKNCRFYSGTNSDYYPAKYVPRYFDAVIHGNSDEIKEFEKLVKKIIGLPRDDYNIILKCIEAFSNSLKLLDNSFDLAYSMLIFCLETLSQNFDDYLLEWSDFNQNNEIDELLYDIDKETAENLRKTILMDKNLKLQKRFVDFIIKNTSESFFTLESNAVEFPIRRSEYERALKNAYNVRSSFAHELQPVLLHLKNPGIARGDYYKDNGNPYFTYSGLLRVTRHVLLNIIQKKPCLEREDYNWMAELPNILVMQVASQHWLGRTDGFKESEAKQRLSAFLGEISLIHLNLSTSITDCTDLMKIYEDIIPRTKTYKKIPLAVHYYLYNFYLPEKQRTQNFLKIAEQLNEEKICDIPTIENILYNILANQKLVWTNEECAEEYMKYKNGKFNSKNLILPQLYEITILIEIANKCYNEGHFEKYQKWVNLAYLESVGLNKLQDFINEKWSEGSLIENIEIMRLFR